MSAINIIKAYAKKSLIKNRGSGIMELPSDMIAEAKAGEIAAVLQRAGIPIEQLDQFIRSEKDLVKFLNIIEATSKPNYTVLSGDEAARFLNKAFPKKGQIIPFKQKRSFAEEIEAMKKSGDLVDPNNLKKSQKVTDREMFAKANERFNKTDVVADIVAKITSMEPVEALKEANKVIQRKGIYKNLDETQSKKILTDSEDWIFQRDTNDLYDYNKNRPFRDDPDFDPDDPDYQEFVKNRNKDDYATGGRAGFSDGLGVEPKINLEKLKEAYERMLKYNDQPTTIDRSILKDLIEAMDEQGAAPNYNVADDVPQEMEAAQGGIAKFYTGGIVDVEPSLSDIGHGSDALMARTRLLSPNNMATTSTGLNYLLAEDNDNIRVPFKKGTDLKRRAFLKLLGALTGGIASIKSGILGLSGKEAPAQATKEVIKQSTPNVPPYFYRLVEKIRFMGDDTVASQDKTIAKKYKDYVMEEDFAGNITIVKSKMDDMYPEEVVMTYQVDDAAVRNKDGFSRNADYEEYTATPDMDGKMKNVEQGVPDEVIEEAGDTTAMTLKKADGGRIGFSGGKLAKYLADKTITGSSRRFLEKVFGKESFERMIENDPELYRGLLETVEMFRKRDKEGLKMYMQKFLPHMDDETVEDFIIGSGGTEGIQGQLIRLGSGRDYAGKIEMMKKADNMRKLDNLEITDDMARKPNASGGIAKLLGE